MPTLLSAIETQSRRHLTETTANFWTSAELIDHEINGVKDLWRSIVDLKGEHFFTRDITNVTLAADTATLSGLPTDVHKILLIEPLDVSENSANTGLIFVPRDYNHRDFQSARTRADIEPKNDVIYYAITQAGGPVGALTIYVAPEVTSAVSLKFIYVPVLGSLTSASNNPIPGEADNAVVAWTVAYARAKEREDRSPDPGWLAIYATEKQHLLQALGLRQYQENAFVEAMWQEYW